MTRTWSPEQLAVFAWFTCAANSVKSRNLVVRARAGTGKTTTILHGIDQAPEARILLAAFNKSIAKELSTKVNNPRAKAMTLHGLGYRFLTRNWSGLDREPSDKKAFNLAERVCGNASDSVVNSVAKLCTKIREIDPWCDTVNGALAIADKFDLLPENEVPQWNDSRICAAALDTVDLCKQRSREFDFADMIFLPLVHNWVRPQFDLVVIDEAQDMSFPQLEMARRVCTSNGRICVVGDDRQAIYAFRGADSGSLDRLKSELGAAELGLTVTYRCPQLVVAEAQKLVPDYQCAPNAEEGTVKTVTREALVEQANEGDFVISRTNAPLAGICLALIRAGVRARVKGRDVGQGLISRIRKMELRDLSELAPRLAEWLEAEKERTQNLDEEVAAKRLDLVQDQVDTFLALADGLATVGELERRIQELFVENAEQQAVCCSTVHKVKGLEAQFVYVLEETFRGDQGEEGNLRYVAVTRAQYQLAYVRG